MLRRLLGKQKSYSGAEYRVKQLRKWFLLAASCWLSTAHASFSGISSAPSIVRACCGSSASGMNFASLWLGDSSQWPAATKKKALITEGLFQIGQGEGT